MQNVLHKIVSAAYGNSQNIQKIVKSYIFGAKLRPSMQLWSVNSELLHFTPSYSSVQNVLYITT